MLGQTHAPVPPLPRATARMTHLSATASPAWADVRMRREPPSQLLYRSRSRMLDRGSMPQQCSCRCCSPPAKCAAMHLRCRSRRQPPALPPAKRAAFVHVRSHVFRLTCTYMHMHIHIRVCASHMHSCETSHVRSSGPWVAVPAIPVRVSRAWNAQVSQCICHVGLSRNWGGITNGLSRQ